jgi:UDP-N-acetylmuramoylalanine--D-glutamate ligase
MHFSGQRILILGYGKSGRAAHDLLATHGATVSIADKRAPALPDVPESLTGQDALVVSPGIALGHPVIQAAYSRGIPVLGEIELAWYFLRGPILAVTGTNGKTTTTSLVGHILGCPVGGNIGFPATAMAAASRFLQWNVLEVSSFQLETVTHFRADIAAILNITPNHLDRHGTFEAYAAAKHNIFRNQRPADWAVLNARQPEANTPAQRALFNGGAAVRNGDAIELFGARLMDVADIPLPGRHNEENVMAAAVLASLAGASHEQIAQRVATFRGVPHRLEFLREVNGVRYYNDSKATSVDATLKALEALPGPLWVILGGVDKGASYQPLAAQLAAKGRAALLIGAAAPLISRDLAGVLPLEAVGTLAAAVAHVARHAAPGDTVLLAPACASFDQFDSFEHRGDTFRRLVEAL